MSSNGSPALSNSQYSNYSNSNTPWTPGEPSEANPKFLTTTSAIKIGAVTLFFSAFGRTPPLTLGSGSSFRHPLEHFMLSTGHCTIKSSKKLSWKWEKWDVLSTTQPSRVNSYYRTGCRCDSVNQAWVTGQINCSNIFFALRDILKSWLNWG